MMKTFDSKLRRLLITSSSYRKYASVATNATTNKKQSVVIIGAGWAGFRVATDLDKAKYDVTLISPRNHFLFTPLLPSTAVGTLEFRCIEEPVRTIPGLHYHQANCNHINFQEKSVSCSSCYDSKFVFIKNYDILIIAAGAETNTFNIEGIANNPNIFFLKSLSDARSIRNRLIESFERAANLSYNYVSEYDGTKIDTEENKKLLDLGRERLLTFVVVGGGPTNVEFTAEL